MVSKLTNRKEVHRQLRYKRDIRNREIRVGKRTLMSDRTRCTVCCLNRSTISNQLAGHKLRLIRRHVERSPEIKHLG